MSQILLVEDEIAVQAFICDTLKDYPVQAVSTVADACSLLETGTVDLLLLDLQLDTENGMAVARYARQKSPYIAIIILTGQRRLESAIQAIEIGAQAYLLKPVRPDKLEQVVSDQLQKMRDLRRRDELASYMQSAVAALQEKDNRIITIGLLTLQHERFEATYDGTDLNLSIAQFRVLWMLAENAGEPVPASALVTHALGYDLNTAEARDLVKGYIFQIRRKLAAAQVSREHIRTVRGEGYVWIPSPYL